MYRAKRLPKGQARSNSVLLQMRCLWKQKSQICKNGFGSSDGEWGCQKTKKVRKLVSPSERAGNQTGGGVNPTLQYAFDEAKIAGYQGNLHQFARTTGLTHELTGGNLVFDAVKLGWDKLAKGAVDKAVQAEKKHQVYKKDKKPHFENSWRAAKELGYKHDYFTFYLSLTNRPLGWTMGSGVDIHKRIGKLPKPKAGWTPGKYKYMGPYNPLEKQLSYDPETGKVTEWKVKPFNKVDEIAAYHDICYDMGRPKGDCDREMVQSLDAMPHGEMPKWGSTARFLINTKQKLGLGLPAKNVRRR